jgi:hypothetical protein
MWLASVRMGMRPASVPLRECLDHFIPVGLKHLDHLVSEYLDNYHRDRSHQQLGDRSLGDRSPGHDSPREEVEVVSHPRPGGVLRHYQRGQAT